MSRRLKVITREVGDLQLFLIYETAGVYETEWRPLQGTDIAALFTPITRELVECALKGYTSPLVKTLGVPPNGALRKLPIAAKECVNKGRCSLFIPRDCVPTAVKMPWCYEPGGIEDENVRRLASEVVGLWRGGVYVLVVSEDP